MIILSHRGYWGEPSEKNSPRAFERTIAESFGTETDIRDCLGRLVVAHDPAGLAAPSLETVLDLFDDRGLTLALNIKADGLVPLLSAAMGTRKIDWFAFDMSVPEMLRYKNAGLPFLTRHSDVEPDPVCYEVAVGVWVDSFEGEWVDEGIVRRHLGNGKIVCLVSSELHGRSNDRLWRELLPLRHEERLFLCTDQPSEAREFFLQ